jgi:hypothetical protein
MSDWQVGDLARCIVDGRRTRAGKIYRVSQVSNPGDLIEGFRNMSATAHLRFTDLYCEPGMWSTSARFRKIEPCEPEFAELLKRQPAFDEAMDRFRKIQGDAR